MLKQNILYSKIHIKSNQSTATIGLTDLDKGSISIYGHSLPLTQIGKRAVFLGSEIHKRCKNSSYAFMHNTIFYFFKFPRKQLKIMFICSNETSLYCFYLITS